MLTAETVKKHARACGADLVGIGSMDRFEGAPPECDPRFIMPEARSIIGLGFRIHRGLLRGIEEGTFFAAYPSMGYANINDQYAPMVLREMGNLLEDNGYEALLYQNTAIRLGCGKGRPVSEGRPAPDVFLHFRIAGVICGMGEIGWSKVFLTPEFGPRQRLAFILTEADLEPDPLFEGGLCDRCMRCAAECPAGAISRDRENTVNVTVAGRELTWGHLEERKCAAVYQGGTAELNPFISKEVAETIDAVINADSAGREGMTDYTGNIWAYLREKLPYIRESWESFHHPATICGARGCMRACMMHLEEQGKLKNTFREPFRRRPPWKLEPSDNYERPVRSSVAGNISEEEL